MTGLDREAAQFEEHPKWYIGSRLILIIAFFVVIGIVFAVGHWAFSWFAAPYQGRLQARQQIQSGDFRIQAYNHFFDLCASVQTLDQALQQTVAQEKIDKGDNLSRDEINYGAQLNSRNDAANQYNADSHKSYTVGQFKANNLPYQINPYVKGKVDKCTAG